jgi:heme exporter protein B
LNYLNFVVVHLRKDLRLEWRSRDAVTAMLFFSLLVVVVFSMAFEPTAAVSRQIAGGIVWMILLFASVNTLNQSWTRELRNHVLDAHRMAPAEASTLFVGKALANMIFVTGVEVVLAPLFTVLFNLHALGQGWLLLLVMPLGTWALVSNGTFFAALGLRTRNRELMLPLVLFPISIPALLAMVQATTGILTGESDPALWIKLLLGYDIIFTTACVMLFETVLNAE